jgi:hypothetical protein
LLHKFQQFISVHPLGRFVRAGVDAPGRAADFNTFVAGCRQLPLYGDPPSGMGRVGRGFTALRKAYHIDIAKGAIFRTFAAACAGIIDFDVARLGPFNGRHGAANEADGVEARST